MSLVRVDTGALLTMVGEAEGSATDGSPFGSSIEKIGNTPETGVRDELRVIRESLPEDNCNIRDLTTVGNRVFVTRTLCGTESTRIMQLRGCVHNIVNTSVEADATAAETITAIMTDIYNQATVLGSEATSNMQADKFADYNGASDLAEGLKNGEFSVDDYIKYVGSNGKLNDVSAVLNSYLDSLSDEGLSKLLGGMSKQEWINSKISEATEINKDLNNAGYGSGGVTGRDTVNVAHWARDGQYNGGQYEYNFSAEFNNGLQESVDKLLGQCKDSCSLTEEDKAHLSSVLPYYLKGIGASESGWSNGSQGYMGLTNQKGVYYASFTFDDSFGPYDLSQASTFTKNEGAEVAAAEFIHWVDYYKSEGYDLDSAIWESWKSYTGGSSGCAAYQMNMANEFYNQDGNSGSLFSGACTDPINNPGNYGVFEYNYDNPETCNC